MKTIVILTVNILYFYTVYTLQCLDSTGKPVDWFIIYKIPKIRKSKNSLVKEGYGFYYMDVNTPKFELSQYGIDTTKHALYYTLQQIYGAKPSSILYGMYNDQTPNKKIHEANGHSKGVVAFDDQQGYWLVHSTPHFPPYIHDGYSWPESARVYGQIFLCVTYDSYPNIDQIGTQFLYNYPDFYNYSIPIKMRKKYPNMYSALSGKKEKFPHHSSIINLISSYSTTFTSFAKDKKFGQDLYHDLVAPFYKSDMRTETWENGKGQMGSNCSQYKVLNVALVGMTDVIQFEDTKDHSKWGITDSGYVCIGDINRESSQFRRNGGTVCFNNHNVWKTFNSLILHVENCNSFP
ncbi:hypothetical protein LOTGIDRAFT_193211 [Lottia gigantea]|uniref:Uncharacterized protein n=1 Tax=Lottia gigantea TaxID=225164 RepID=V4BIV3_LOTGI|nr:hypothetical protein LOTGIDRAFT_193211 [Lottia gigantea]ESO88549.1 hypothetical protein LOTGIDRAFT_193211 [Lottia gigantea]